MSEQGFNPDHLSIPRWTIGRDPGSPDCAFCHSIIVRVTTEARQMAFCGCRLVEYRLLPKPQANRVNTAKP